MANSQKFLGIIFLLLHLSTSIFCQQDIIEEAYVSCQINLIPVTQVQFSNQDIIFNYDAEMTATNDQIMSDMWYIFGVAARVYPHLEKAHIDYYQNGKKWMRLSLDGEVVQDYVNDRRDEEAVFKELIMTDFEVILEDGSYEKTVYGGGGIDSKIEDEKQYEDIPGIERVGRADGFQDRVNYIIILAFLLFLVGLILLFRKLKIAGIIFIMLGTVLTLYHFNDDILTGIEHQASESDNPDMLSQLEGFWLLNTWEANGGLLKDRFTISVNELIVEGVNEAKDISFTLSSSGLNQLSGTFDNKGVKSEVLVSYDKAFSFLHFEILVGLPTNPTIRLDRE